MDVQVREGRDGWGRLGLYMKGLPPKKQSAARSNFTFNFENLFDLFPANEKSNFKQSQIVKSPASVRTPMRRTKVTQCLVGGWGYAHRWWEQTRQST